MDVEFFFVSLWALEAKFHLVTLQYGEDNVRHRGAEEKLAFCMKELFKTTTSASVVRKIMWPTTQLLLTCVSWMFQVSVLSAKLPQLYHWNSREARHFLASSASSLSFSCLSRSRLISFSSCLYFRSMKRFWWAICGKLSGAGRETAPSQPRRADKKKGERQRQRGGGVRRPGRRF